MFYSEYLSSQKLLTFYLGGGTPSVLTAEALEKLLSNLLTNIKLSDETEITVECNPETLTEEKAKLFRKYNVNRISLGCQSFLNDRLKKLERNTTVDEIISAVALLRRYGFSNINLDLIIGQFDSHEKDFYNDLEMLINLNPEHVSVYILTVESERLKKKVFANEVVMPSEEKIENEYLSTVKLLEGAGIFQYEVSNFAKKGFECRHNLSYWKGCSYIGLGASACGFYMNNRYQNYDDVRKYMTSIEERKQPLLYEETIDIEKEKLEYVFLRLRTTEGIILNDFLKRYDFDFEECNRDYIRMLLDKEYAVLDEDRFSLTPRGFLIMDTIISELEF